MLSSSTTPIKSSFDHCMPLFAISSKLVPILGVNVKNRHSFFQRFVISHLCGTSASWGEEPNMDDLILPNGRFIPVISEFRDTYFGKLCHKRRYTDSKDVRARINSAAHAFGAPSKCIFQSTHVNCDAKQAVYEILILSIIYPYRNLNLCLYESI